MEGCAVSIRKPTLCVVAIYDNSIDGQLPRLLYRTVDGTVFKKYTDDIPEWAQTICQWSR